MNSTEWSKSVWSRRWQLCGAALASMLFVFAGDFAVGENWPQWRGPAGNGVSDENGIPSQWGIENNVAWRLPLPGAAGATPVVWEDRIFLTSAEGDDLLVLCVGTNGREIWRQKAGTGNRSVGFGDAEGNYASPSPSTDGKHVWVFMGTGDLACYDFDGNEIWKTNLQESYGPFDIQFGMASTPLLHRDRLYLQIIHGPMRGEGEPSYVVAIDKRTGEEVWKKDRQTGAERECKHSYASPILYQDKEREYLLTHGSDYIIAHDLDSGEEIWRHGGLNPPLVAGAEDAQTGDIPDFLKAFDVNDDGKVIRLEIPEGRQRRLFDLFAARQELDASKPYTLAELAQKAASGVSGSGQRGAAEYHPTLRFIASPAAAPGLIVVPSAKRGAVLALRPDLSGDATGSHEAQLWGTPRGTPDVPSPLIHEGLVYFCDEGGIITCRDAETGEQKYQERIHSQRYRASPVFAEGKLFLTARDGRVTVLRAGPEFEVIAENEINEDVAASPAISNGRIYLRSFEALWAIGGA